jgi:hypothetical protein
LSTRITSQASIFRSAARKVTRAVACTAWPKSTAPSPACESPPGARAAIRPLLFISNIRERFTLVGLDEQKYLRMLDDSATAGILGGAIYDAILGHCALKAGAETIYTWNTKDFLRLRAAIAGRVKTPDQARI